MLFVFDVLFGLYREPVLNILSVKSKKLIQIYRFVWDSINYLNNQKYENDSQ